MKRGFLKVDSSMLSSIGRAFSYEEIEEAIFGIGAFKAPGVNDLSDIFFHSQWEVIKHSICNLV